MEGTIGQVKLFGGNFVPRGWAFCEGQVVSIAENEALFSILGTMYGGNGRSTFALPDLRGRSIVGVGRGPGLSQINEGQKGGVASTSLSVADGAAAEVGTATPINAVTGVSPRTIDRSPYLGLRFIICLQGLYPPRS